MSKRFVRRKKIIKDTFVHVPDIEETPVRSVEQAENVDKFKRHVDALLSAFESVDNSAKVEVTQEQITVRRGKDLGFPIPRGFDRDNFLRLRRLIYTDKIKVRLQVVTSVDKCRIFFKNNRVRFKLWEGSDIADLKFAISFISDTCINIVWSSLNSLILN